MAVRFSSSRFVRIAFCAITLAFASCGYGIRNSVRSLPAGIQSLGVPTFQNMTSQYKLEQRVSAAVLKEFAARTRVPVNSRSSGVDAVVLGVIQEVSSTPVTFGSETFASAFLITVRMSVKLMRTSDSKVLWENSDFMFRERYILNARLRDFFSEEHPALDRLAREFASSLVSTVIDGSIP